MKYDFGGWATRNNLRCADGRIIRKNAFKVNDGQKVPLVWNHQHNSASDVLGHAKLENRNEGVYAYCSFNNTAAGNDAKEAVKHGDVTALSIWANNLQQNGSEVLHGSIREVSLVLAGANPGAFIESVLAHGEPMDYDDEEGIFYTDDDIIVHADLETGDDEVEEEDEEVDEDKTVKEVFDTLNDEQKKAVAIIIGQAIEDARGENDEEEEMEVEEDEEVKHNLFDDDDMQQDGVTHLSHSDMETIFTNAKRCGSLKEAVMEYIGEDAILSHSIDTTGMTTAIGKQTYGFNDPEMLFPEYRTVNGNTPEWLSRNMDWVTKVMGGVHHTPFSRIKSVFADITEDDARAKGYLKGKMKKEEFFTTLKRTTDPQTVYKKQKMDRDDIIDITDFDVVAWIRAEMRVMLNEELARAILIGDGRASDSDDKIKEDHVRPIVKDVPLFNTVIKITAGTDEAGTAKNTINGIIRGRKNYKGSGNPTFFTTEDVLTEMLLLEDNNGRAIYKTEQELATKLRVKEIVTVEVMDNQKVGEDDLLGVIVNLSDYNVGADRGGEINTFEDFDIDYNQHKYLIETRVSGSLIKPYSALTIVKAKATSSGGTTSEIKS